MHIETVDTVVRSHLLGFVITEHSTDNVDLVTDCAAAVIVNCVTECSQVQV